MFWETILLTFRLLFDRRVPIATKLMPLVAFLYFVSPIDFIPDVLGIVGVVDDLSLLTLMINLFIRSTADDILAEHVDRMSRSNKLFRIAKDMPPTNNSNKNRRDERVIHGEIIDD